jgi:general secretion pathway protein G
MLRALFAAILSLACVFTARAGNVGRTMPGRSLESTLRWQLSAMRIAIDTYTLDKERLPLSLQDLVSTHYLSEIPTDPFTQSKDWVCEIGEVNLGEGFNARGLYEVHSRSNKVAADGSRYASW